MSSTRSSTRACPSRPHRRPERHGGVSMAEQSITTRRARRADADFYALPAQKRFPIARRFMQNRLAVAGLVVIVLFVIAAVFEPLLARYPYDELLPGKRNLAPSSEHWLGTDRAGRDVYSRLIKGGQVSLAAGFAAV